VTTGLSEAVYLRLITAKLYTGKSLKALVAEGCALVALHYHQLIAQERITDTPPRTRGDIGADSDLPEGDDRTRGRSLSAPRRRQRLRRTIAEDPRRRRLPPDRRPLLDPSPRREKERPMSSDPRPPRSWPRIGLTLAIIVLALLQIALTWEFWGSFGDGHDGQRLVFQGLGAMLAIVEALALVVAADNAARGAWGKALVATLVFVPTFVVNLGSDISAIAAYSARDTAVRSQSIAAYERNEMIVREAEARLPQMRRLLEEQNLDQPAAALLPQVETLRARLERRDAAGLRVTEASRQNLARLESAHATAVAIEQLSAERDAARAALAEIGARPHESHAQFETIAKVLQGFGLQVTPDDVRVWIAFAVGVVIKLWLAFGLWFASASAPRPKDDNQLAMAAVDETPEADPIDAPASAESPPPSQAPSPPPGRAPAKSRETLDLLDELGAAGRA
jgi:hypothetical protein